MAAFPSDHARQHHLTNVCYYLSLVASQPDRKLEILSVLFAVLRIAVTTLMIPETIVGQFTDMLDSMNHDQLIEMVHLCEFSSTSVLIPMPTGSISSLSSTTEAAAPTRNHSDAAARLLDENVDDPDYQVVGGLSVSTGGVAHATRSSMSSVTNPGDHDTAGQDIASHDVESPGESTGG